VKKRSVISSRERTSNNEPSILLKHIWAEMFYVDVKHDGLKKSVVLAVLTNM